MNMPRRVACSGHKDEALRFANWKNKDPQYDSQASLILLTCHAQRQQPHQELGLMYKTTRICTANQE